MSKRFAAIAAVASAIALPAAAEAQNVVRPSSVKGSTTVPAGGVKTLTLQCPATAVALNAAITKRNAGVTVRDSVPGTGVRDWRFRLAAGEGAQRRRVSAVLRCVRLHLPAGVNRVQLFVATRTAGRVAIPAGSSIGVRLRCGDAFVGTGYGIGGSDVNVAAAVPNAHGWNFRLENTGATDTTARVRIRCLKQTAPGRAGGAPTTLRFQVARPTFRDDVGPGANRTFSNACTRRQFSVATGVSFDWSDDITLSRSHPASPWAGVWAFGQASGIEVVRSHLVCLGRTTQFG